MGVKRKTYIDMIVVNSKGELKELINQRIKEQGPNCNLNDIDVSKITDMSYLFIESDFNGDISEWDTSNVEDMEYMFSGSKFTGDISKWDVSSVENMSGMFYYSEFDGDLSKWDVSNVETMEDIFTRAPLGEHEPEWWFRHRE